MIPHALRNASRPQRYAACALIMLALGAADVARAEKADREKPINLEADRVFVDDAKQIATFEGRVVLTQGTLIIRGDRMEVRQDAQGFSSGVTWGKLAYFRQKREGYDEYIEGWAERIEYDGRADKVQMFNQASMKKGGDEVRGSYIAYDANTEFFQVVGDKQAGGDGRVRAVLQPKPKVKPAAQPPVSLTPADSVTAPRESPQSPKR